MRFRHLIPVAMILVALGGCAKEKGPDVATAGGPGAKASSGAPVDEAEQGRKFAQCMREHGVNVPDPEPGGPTKIDRGAIDKTKLNEAMQACKDLMPNGGKTSQLTPEQLEQARAFARCMREHGVDVPDPHPDTGMVDIITDGQGDLESPEFQVAVQVCCQYLPCGGG